MKKLLKTTLFILSCYFLLPQLSHGQNNYNTGVGLRLGSPVSVSLKHFFSEAIAGEAYLGTRGYSGYRWTNISAALQWHKPIESVEGLNWYLGGGASIFFWSFNNNFFFSENFNTTTFGLQGYLGLEYIFEGFPISLTADWVPTIFINGFTSGFGAGFGSLGIRYVFGQ